MAIRYHYSEAAGQEAIVNSETPLFYPLHMHMRHWTLGLVRRGAAELERPDGTRRMETGGLFTVPPRMPHSLRIAAHSELLVLCFAEECALRRNCGLLSAIHRFFVGQEDELVERMIEQMSRQAIVRQERQAGGAIDRLAQRLVAQPEEALSVVEMARIACASPWHFLRRFQAETGMTPHAFLLNCRIRRLRTLLRGRVAAVDAAFLLGFADQSHMHKLFKLHHNLTPRQFVLASDRLDEPIC